MNEITVTPIHLKKDRKRKKRTGEKFKGKK